MSPYDFHISTPRLYLSYLDPSSDEQCDFTLALYHGAPSVRRYPGVIKDVPDREAARKIAASGDEKLRATGYGRYIISLKPESPAGDEKTGVPFSQRKLERIGIVSMQLGRVAGEQAPTMPDVGFNMMERYHGKGKSWLYEIHVRRILTTYLYLCRICNGSCAGADQVLSRGERCERDCGLDRRYERRGEEALPQTGLHEPWSQEGTWYPVVW